MNAPAAAEVAATSVARRIARYVLAFDRTRLDARLEAKVKRCLLDGLACVLQSRELPWSRQALALAHASGDCTLIGEAHTASVADAAFANGTMAHGLVQEDMHPASVSHIGVIVIPTVLAIAEQAHARGEDAMASLIVGYQVMARLGRALVTRESARTFRPSGMTGAIAGACAGARLTGLSEDETVNAIGLAANTAAGFNEWPRTGGSEMFFHAGWAARNAVGAVLLARAGAQASESIIEGPGGMLAAYRAPAAAVGMLETIDGEPEILDVYHKPVPACNYTQTPAQAALAIARREPLAAEAIRAVRVLSFPEAIQYPGCDHVGPFATGLQAKMSIQYVVATALATGRVSEESFLDRDDPRIRGLAARVSLAVDPEFAAGFPARQGAEVIVELADGRMLRSRLDDLVPADEPAIRARFREAASSVFGAARAEALERDIDRLRDCADMATFMQALRA